MPTGLLDEIGLLAIASDYMDSLTANDPAGAPCHPSMVSTENGAAVSLTEGVWKMARGWGYRHTFVDVERSEIGAFGVVRENDDNEALISFRLKVEDGLIIENEMLVVRPGDFMLFAPRAMTEPKPVFASPVSPDRRASRAGLEAVARNYFEAIAACDPAKVSIHPDANRVENGFLTTNNPTLLLPSMSEGLKRLAHMHSYRDLRFPVVDVERGLVWALVAFDMPEMTKTLTIRGRSIEISPQRNRLPRTMFLFELFKIENGQIRAVEAILRDMPLGSAMGWPRPAPG